MSNSKFIGGLQQNPARAVEVSHAQLDGARSGHSNTSRQQRLIGLMVMALLPLSARAQNFTFNTVDVPGADSTELNGINQSGFGFRSRSTIIGTYHDIGGKHGFSLGGGISQPFRTRLTGEIQKRSASMTSA